MKRIQFLPALLVAVFLAFVAYGKGKPGGKPGGGGGGGSGVTNPAFVYSAQAKGNKPTQLYVAMADGSKTERLTNENHTHHGNPVWAPDGTKIAFLGRASSTDPWTDGIYVYTLSSSSVALAYSAEATVALDGDSDMAWSSDGTEIAFTTANNEIFVLDVAAGTALAVLQYADGYNPVRHLDWSPDGTEIVFSGNSPGQGSSAQDDLFVLEVATGTITNITNSSSVEDAEPTWTTDGIAHLRSGAVYTMDADGANATQIVVASGSSRKDVRWSPDGLYISYLEAEVLKRVRVSSGTVSEVVSSRFGIEAADWNPDWTNDLD